MALFGSWLKGQIDARGWDHRTAAHEIGVHETNIHNWIYQGIRPGRTNALRIARALGVPLETVYDQADYDMPSAGIDLSDAELSRRRAEVLAELPQFADIIDIVARKPPARQAVYIDIIRRVLLDPQESDQESNR